MKMVEIVTISISLLILLVFILAFIGMWTINSDPLSDIELYGMDAEEYLKERVGEKYYNKYYKDK